MSTPKPLASVSRALTLVEYLATRDPDGTPLGTIAADMGLNKATVYNTLATLREHNWVEQDNVTGYYRLGDGIAPIAAYRTSTRRTVDQLRPYLATIGRRFNELVHLGQLADTEVIYLDKVEPDRPIRVVSAVGKRATAVTTSLGRALIGSFADRDAQLAWYMDTPDMNLRTKADQREVRRRVIANFVNLDERGWTEEIEENEPGIACVGVPLLGPNGKNLAISVSAPAERMSPEYRADIARGIREELDKLPESLHLHTRPITPVG
ncbi:IclR family transcriptional regulator [Trueperella pecoris]|uniref:IclR family transcriptional regulator n=1 Tax=Trueperella pecoris TaxID=2733571 RepID=UPI00186B81B5|nr:IclR family transcriptional regulator [Trueperella pecoris]QOQ39653.1 IclR family transcriptional regulator [Trueperella pecoris]QTG75560.1 IclR family transcriptional regulator [Trueperella pecoris]